MSSYLTNKTPYVVLGVSLLVGVGAFVGWRVYEGRPLPAPLVVAAPQPVDAGAIVAAPAPLNLDDGDRLLKDGAPGVSGQPTVLKWLSQPALVRRLVAAVLQISEGESPREALGFLIVPGPFSAAPLNQGDGRLFMSSRSTARYDSVAALIGSIDAAAAGGLYTKLRPFAESAFFEIAAPGKTFDDTLQRAIDHLAAVPLGDSPLELAPLDGGIGYQYVDPTLERLSRAQKHLLRMGPANARIVVAKLKDFRSAR